MKLSRATRLASVTAAALALAATLSACAASNGPVAGQPEEEIEALRRLTAEFQDIGRAAAAGYDEMITPCWYHRELGGQGYHYGKTDLIDGQVSLLEPELLMYEPDADGTLRLTAIEYIVPIASWEQNEPPFLLGRHLHPNEALGLFVLHVWLWKENPSGMYADWNPNVSCANAAESEDRA